MNATASASTTTVHHIIPMALNGRDRAILTAVAAGRCALGAGAGAPLLIDGRCCSDQFACGRLCAAGLIRTVDAGAELTAAGHDLLTAA